MNRTLLVLVGALLAVSIVTTSSHAGLFVATAKNLRGAMYLGAGPTPQHASEQALVKCSQDSFVPPSCRVICVRMEAPPCPPPAPMRKPMKLYKKSSYQPGYPMGMPRP